MNSSAWRSRLAALVTACLACLCLLSLGSATAWAKGGTIKEFPVPTSGSEPDSITTGPDGNLWFTEETGNAIGRITTGGSITEFHVLGTCGLLNGCEPRGITRDSLLPVPSLAHSLTL